MSTNNVHTHQFRNSKLDNLLAKVRPAFTSWLETDRAFQKDTATVAMQVRKAWELYKEGENATRAGFARLFDSRIAEDVKTRDLADNATYNRLNYLIDQVGREGRAETPREPVTEKRKRIQHEWMRFRKSHAKKPIELSEVETLLAHVLAQIWNEEAVKEVIAA